MIEQDTGIAEVMGLILITHSLEIYFQAKKAIALIAYSLQRSFHSFPELPEHIKDDL